MYPWKPRDGWIFSWEGFLGAMSAISGDGKGWAQRAGTGGEGQHPPGLHGGKRLWDEGGWKPVRRIYSVIMGARPSNGSLPMSLRWAPTLDQSACLHLSVPGGEDTWDSQYATFGDRSLWAACGFCPCLVWTELHHRRHLRSSWSRPIPWGLPSSLVSVLVGPLEGRGRWGQDLDPGKESTVACSA